MSEKEIEKISMTDVSDDDMETVTGGTDQIEGYCRVQSHRAETLMFYKTIKDPEKDVCHNFMINSYYCERGPCYMCAHFIGNSRSGYCTHPSNTIEGVYIG